MKTAFLPFMHQSSTRSLFLWKSAKSWCILHIGNLPEQLEILVLVNFLLLQGKARSYRLGLGLVTNISFDTPRGLSACTTRTYRSGNTLLQEHRITSILDQEFVFFSMLLSGNSRWFKASSITLHLIEEALNHPELPLTNIEKTNKLLCHLGFLATNVLTDHLCWYPRISSTYRDTSSIL